MDIPGLVYAFFNTAGPGGVVVVAVLLGGLLIYYRLTRWILHGNQPEE